MQFQTTTPHAVLPHLLQVKRITDNIRPDRQSIMFTSTSSPAIEALARDILTNPVEVKVRFSPSMWLQGMHLA